MQKQVVQKSSRTRKSLIDLCGRSNESDRLIYQSKVIFFPTKLAAPAPALSSFFFLAASHEGCSFSPLEPGFLPVDSLLTFETFKFLPLVEEEGWPSERDWFAPPNLDRCVEVVVASLVLGFAYPFRRSKRFLGSLGCEFADFAPRVFSVVVPVLTAPLRASQPEFLSRWKVVLLEDWMSLCRSP